MNNKTGIQLKEFDIDKSVTLRGIMACVVLIHHLYQNIDILHGTPIGGILQLSGYLSVSIFFFISGYGLAAQYVREPNVYIEKYPRNRILTFYCTYLVILLVYIIYNFASAGFISPANIIQSFFYGYTVVSKGWYFQTQLVMYILFFISMKFCKKAPYSFLFVSVLLFFIVNYFAGMETTWYESVFCFFVGCIWKINEKRVLITLSRFKTYICGLVFMMLVFCFTCIIGNIILYGSFMGLCFKAASSVTFSILIITLLYRVKLPSFIFYRLGKVSLEIYAFQGIPLSLFRSDYIYIHNDFAFIILVVILLTILVFIFHPALKIISKLAKKR